MDDDKYLSDDDTECLKVVRACPGVTAWHLPPRLRPSLRRLEKLKLIRFDGGGWWPRSGGRDDVQADGRRLARGPGGAPARAFRPGPFRFQGRAPAGEPAPACDKNNPPFPRRREVSNSGRGEAPQECGPGGACTAFRPGLFHAPRRVGRAGVRQK
jgi:hypothetical protein